MGLVEQKKNKNKKCDWLNKKRKKGKKLELISKAPRFLLSMIDLTGETID